MTLFDVMTELIALAERGMPTAEAVARAFASRATRQDSGVGRPNDLALTLQGDVARLTVWEDGRGWGAYAALAVAKGALAELEEVVGPTQPVARNPDDFTSGETRSAYVPRAGKTVRVFAELDKRDPAQVRSVTVHFQR